VWALRSGGGAARGGLASLFDLGLDDGGVESGTAAPSPCSSLGGSALALLLPFPRRYLSVVDAALAVDAHSALWALARTAGAYLRYRAACKDLFGTPRSRSAGRDADDDPAAAAAAAAVAAAVATEARCPICLDALQAQQQSESAGAPAAAAAVVTACGHCFHGDCLRDWLQRGCAAAAGGGGRGLGASSSLSLEGTPCPLCRQPLERKVLRRRRELEEKEQLRRGRQRE